MPAIEVEPDETENSVAPTATPSPRRRTAQRWLLGVLASLVVLSSSSLMLESSSLWIGTESGTLELYVVPSIRNDQQLVPKWAKEIEQEGPWEIPEEDRLHLSLLHAACVSEKDLVIPWRHGAPGESQETLLRFYSHNKNTDSHNADEAHLTAELIRQDDPNLLEKLRECPDVDVFLPKGLRGNGYCEDAVAYAKYLHTRLLPMWVFETKMFDPKVGKEVDYFDLCPSTPVIFFNHYWEDLPSHPRWPEGSQKPLYLMPNIEMYELSEVHLWRADVVLCKTRVCHERVTKWYTQEGNPRDTKVFYTKHTSSDQAAFARRALGTASSTPSATSDGNGTFDAVIAAKDFETVKFVHTAGTSVWKGTRQVVDCWLSQRDLPPLELYIDDESFNMVVGRRYNSRIKFAGSDHPITVTKGRLNAIEFDKLMADTAFFLCPSIMEGYGHYINQARASGAVVVTTDANPMNELITSSDMGVLIPARAASDPMMMLGGTHQGSHALHGVEGGLSAGFSSGSVCRSIKEFVKSTTPDQRRAMATRAKQAYHDDTRFFARAMAELRVFARKGERLQ